MLPISQVFRGGFRHNMFFGAKQPMRMINCAGPTAAAVMLSAATIVSAQVSPEVTATERAASAYVAAHFATGRVLFDTTGGSTVGYPSTPPRTLAENQDLGRRMGASQLGRAADYRSCASRASADCDVVGFDVVISTGRPLIQGDSAFIAVHRLFHARSGHPEMSRQDYRLRLVRRGGTWAVVGATLTGIS